MLTLSNSSCKRQDEVKWGTRAHLTSSDDADEVKGSQAKSELSKLMGTQIKLNQASASSACRK